MMDSGWLQAADVGMILAFMDRTAEPGTLVALARRNHGACRGRRAASLGASTHAVAGAGRLVAERNPLARARYGRRLRQHIDRIVHEDGPRWRHISPRARMKKARYDLLPFEASFADFARQRGGLQQ